jgi:hypothetical protein
VSQEQLKALKLTGTDQTDSGSMPFNIDTSHIPKHHGEEKLPQEPPSPQWWQVIHQTNM